MMRRFVVAVLLVASLLLGGTPAIGSLKLGVQDSCACGGYIYVLWTLIYWPNGMDSEPWCERHWNNGNTTWTICY